MTDQELLDALREARTLREREYAELHRRFGALLDAFDQLSALVEDDDGQEEHYTRAMRYVGQILDVAGHAGRWEGP